MESYTLNQQVPVISRYDVLVCGSGPSGICAAVAAARMGAKVGLVERYGSLGGCLFAGNVGPVMGSVARGTLRDELTGLLRVGFNDMQGKVGRVHDTVEVPGILADYLDRNGVSVHLQSPVAATLTDSGNVKGVIVAGKEGLAAIEAKVTIDATGDGDVAYLGGAEYELGREEDGLTQPVTLMYTIAGVQEPALTCIGEEDNVQFCGERWLDFTARCVEQGILPPNTQSVRMYHSNVPGERLINTTQINGINPFKYQDIFKAELELRRQIDQITDFLRRYVPGFQNCFVKNVASTLGVREGRRIMGEYVLKVEDLRAGRRFEDVVVHKANFTVDIHNPTGGGQAEGLAEVVQPYDIPYRCLIPRKLDNLILTGRCISGTHHAHASYRIMTVCMALGEAAGVAAALACSTGTLPRSLDAKLVQKQLLANGAVLFDE